jgi:tetratricopeptide (TPR) repeat protein
MEKSTMAKPPKPLTVFGKDLDDLLGQAGKLSIREYADQAGVDYQYISQLRHMPNRHPGRLYTSLLKPFVRLKILGVAEAHQLSIRHRRKPLSLAECKDIFPELTEQELEESIQQALESKDGKTAVPPPATYSPLYQRVFVGREAELNQLQSAFNSTISRQGSLMMVVGEPGIGKTALCEQLAAYVTSKGGKTLIGHCYSERSLSLPYLAFVEALGSYARSRDAMELKKELGTGAADIARIIPEVRERLKVQPRPKVDPEEERYRLMQAVTDFLGSAAAAQPLLIVLEDLHSADKGTLEMLGHVARYLADKRLLLVGTYRDVEVDRTHPLSAAMAELRRLPTFGRVLLRGLNADEVRRMLSSITEQEVPWGLAEAVHRQTEGNPLFVQEVVRYLMEEGVIVREKGRWQATKETPLEMSIPEGLRDVIGKRLSRLSAECNRLLSIAAVIGREFPMDVLQKVAGIPDEELFKALEEAIKAAVIEEKAAVLATINYRFAHAFFRQTLYEEIIAPRRSRLHQQVARALEEVYKTRLEEHAAELAEHFSYSSDAADLKKAVSYGEMAAKRATDVYAYGEATRLLEQAIKVQEVLDPEDKAKKCDLLLDLGDAMNYAGEPRHVVDIEAPAALSLAEAIGDTARAARACILTIEALQWYGNSEMYMTPEYAQWAERADRYAEPETVERALADSAMATVKFAAGHPGEGVLLGKRAVDLARRLGDPETFWWVAGSRISRVTEPHHPEEQLRLAEELLKRPRAGVRFLTLAGALCYIGWFFLLLGQRQRYEEVHSEYRARGERSGQAHFVLVSMCDDGLVNYMDGRLEEAVDISRRIRTRGEELRLFEWAVVWAVVCGLRPRIYLGRADRALQRNIEGARDPTVKLLCLAHLGREAEARAMLDQLVLARPGIDTAEDKTSVSSDIILLEAAALVRHREAAELLLHRLAGSSIRTTGQIFLTCTARHLGGAAALLGRYEEARQHYQEAIKVCTEMPFRPELALSRLQLAELLLEHYPDEKKEALEHLDFAIKEFREMKMQPSLERTLRHKEILKA